MVLIDVGTPKTAQENLRVLQGVVARGEVQGSNSSMLDMISNMLDQLETHRPHGVDGKHGDLHTETCGCLDKQAVPIPLWRNTDVSVINAELIITEETKWSNHSVTYRHRVQKKDRWDFGTYWGEWIDGQRNE